MKEFLESREFKKIQINLGLSILLLSLVTTIKGVFNSANSFQLLECLSIGVSAIFDLVLWEYSEMKIILMI